MNRYERARASLPRGIVDQLRTAFARQWSRPVQDIGEAFKEGRATLGPIAFPAPGGGPSIRCLCSVELYRPDGLGIEEHLSISRGPGVPPPSWDDLVLVRSVAWDDDAEVVQVLPALTGPLAESWFDQWEGTTPEVEVLHLRRYRDRRR